MVSSKENKTGEYQYDVIIWSDLHLAIDYFYSDPGGKIMSISRAIVKTILVSFKNVD